ncbi:unnamed protein product [Sphagnum tenellum]
MNLRCHTAQTLSGCMKQQDWLALRIRKKWQKAPSEPDPLHPTTVTEALHDGQHTTQSAQLEGGHILVHNHQIKMET